MNRKLIQHGMSSLTVSLPKRWTTEKNLKKGDEVEVEARKGSVVISAKKRHEHKSLILDVSGSGSMIRRMMGSAYKSGYDEMRIEFSSHEELKTIQSLVREQFMGFEIVKQEKDVLMLENLSGNDFEEFNNALRRFFFVISNMGSEFLSALESNDPDWLKNTSLQKIESDKFADYCRRAINLGIESGYERQAPLYTVIEQLEKVADRYAELCALLSDGKKPSIALLRASKQVVSFEKMFSDIFFKFEYGKMPLFGLEKQKTQRLIDDSMASCPKAELKAFSILDRVLNLVFDLNGPMMVCMHKKA
ncbi:phosphate uptake regulator PhoU [Candidatus Woesearchaeota archaeon]|nr:phosphate uptake regulator PhoU [Candidatus Woesearchaeota archaeon]